MILCFTTEKVTRCAAALTNMSLLTGKQESQLALRINGGVTSMTVTVHGIPPEGLMKWKTPKLNAGSVPVGLPVAATAFIMNKGLIDSVVRVMSSPNICLLYTSDAADE